MHAATTSFDGGNMQIEHGDYYNNTYWTAGLLDLWSKHPDNDAISEYSINDDLFNFNILNMQLDWRLEN